MAELYTCARFRITVTRLQRSDVKQYLYIIQMISNDRFFEYLACCVVRHGILLFFLNGCKLEVFSNLESTKKLQTFQAWNRQALHWFASHLPESTRDNVENTMYRVISTKAPMDLHFLEAFCKENGGCNCCLFLPVL